METGLIKDEEISLLLLTLIPINDICTDIIDLKNNIERTETLNYHIERWETISSKYFQSFEKNQQDETIPYSYTINDKDFIAVKDKCLHFYNETGISFQVRSLLLSILKCPDTLTDNILNCSLFEWRKDDDDLYSVLSKKIMYQF